MILYLDTSITSLLFDQKIFFYYQVINGTKIGSIVGDYSASTILGAIEKEEEDALKL